MSLGLVVLEEKLFTRTPTPESDDIKTVSVAVLDCKQNVSFIVFCRLVYFMKRIDHFWCKFGIVNFWEDI